MPFTKPPRSADKVSNNISVSNTVELVWETVACSRSSGAKAAVSELGSCAWLHVGSCVGGYKSMTPAGLCSCPNTVCHNTVSFGFVR